MLSRTRLPVMVLVLLMSLAVVVAAVAAIGLIVSLASWRMQRLADRRLAEVVPTVERPEPWVLDRPDEVDTVISALRRRHGVTVGITTMMRVNGTITSCAWAPDGESIFVGGSAGLYSFGFRPA